MADTVPKIFQLIPDTVDAALSAGLHSQQAVFIQFVLSIALASVILYLTFQGFLVIFGKVQAPIQDTLFKLVSLVVILGLATDTKWVTYIQDTINGVKHQLCGSHDTYYHLDELIGSIWDVLRDESGKWSVLHIGQALEDIFSWLIYSLGVLLIVAALGVSLILNEVILKFLLVLTPLFVFCLSFQVVRGMFNNWLQIIFSNILYFVLLNTIIVNALPLSSDLANKSGEDQFSFLYSVAFLAGAFVIAKTIVMLKEIAVQIASVSAEGVSHSIGAPISNAAANFILSGGKTAAVTAGRQSIYAAQAAYERATAKSPSPLPVPQVRSLNETIGSSKMKENWEIIRNRIIK